MAEDSPLHPHIGRKAPASGAHLLLNHSNIFFVAVNSKDAMPRMNQTVVKDSLTRVWREEAACVGGRLLSADA